MGCRLGAKEANLTSLVEKVSFQRLMKWHESVLNFADILTAIFKLVTIPGGSWIFHNLQTRSLLHTHTHTHTHIVKQNVYIFLITSWHFMDPRFNRLS